MKYLILSIVAIYIIWMAVTDLLHKEIPVVPGIVCILVVSLVQILSGNAWTGWLPGSLIGVFLFLLNRITRGKIGKGDALVYVVTGAALGFAGNLELLMFSLLLASVGALVLIVFRRVGRNYAMPFIPFTAAAFGMVVLL
jgi:leader peptidase (prepilin peptidase)/N-methyltransferase